MTGRTAHQGTGGLALEREVLTGLVLKLTEVLTVLLRDVAALHRGSTRRRHRSHLTGALEMVMDGHGLLVGRRMRGLKMTRSRVEALMRSRCNALHGFHGNRLELFLAIVIDGFVQHTIVDLESGGADEASAVNEDVLRISLLTDVAETAVFVPVLDDTNFGHFVECEFFLLLRFTFSLF